MDRSEFQLTNMYLLRVSCFMFSFRCQEYDSEQGKSLGEKRKLDFALDKPFCLPCGRGKAMAGI